MTELVIEPDDLKKWPLPPLMPREVDGFDTIGLPLPEFPDRQDLKAAWFEYDPLNWEIKPFRRRELYNMMKTNLESWAEWLDFDSTQTFHAMLEQMRKDQDGGTIGIRGPKGSSKSIGGQIVLFRCLNPPNAKEIVPPHVLFQYADMEQHVKQYDLLNIGKFGLIIDEDLTATASDSRNLAIHVNNTFETTRKAELWAICTGVNLSFKGWGDTLDLRLEPFGFNRRFQCTRFGIFGKDSDFVGLMALQRKHLPDDPVYYYNELGTYAEYKARAKAYSLQIIRLGGAQRAYNPQSMRENMGIMRDHIVKLYKCEDWGAIPALPDLQYEYEVELELPAKSVGYMNRIIARATREAKKELGLLQKPDQDKEPKTFGSFSKDWKGLRDFIEQWLLQLRPARPEYATATALWIVPDKPPLSQDDVFDLIDFGANPVKVGTLAREIRNMRKRIQRPDRAFTDFTESWVASQLEPLSARKLGGQDRADILLPSGKQVAVKFCVRNDPFYSYTVAPETQGAVVIIIPRQLQFFVIPIEQAVTNERLHLDNADTRAGGGLVGIDELVKTVQEMIQD